MRGNIAIVSRGDLFPPHHGAAVKILHCAAALSRRRDVFIVTDNPEHYLRYRHGTLARLRYPLVVRDLTARMTGGFDAVRTAGLPPADARLYAPLWDRRYDVRLEYVAAWHGVTVFQGEEPAFVRPCIEIARRRDGRTILSEHNIDFERLREQCPGLSPTTRKWLRDVEVDLCRRVDAVVTVSRRDRATLIRAGVTPSRITVIPHGVDRAAYRRRYTMNVRKMHAVPAGTALLVFHGTFQYAPNADALRVIAREILPALRARHHAVKLLAIGVDPPADIVGDDIIRVGPVDRLAPYLLSADVAVVPLGSGGGTRLKLLEYFAAALPVVATRKAVEGLEVKNQRELVIRNDAKGIAAAVARLLDHPSEARALGRRGRRYVRNLDWQQTARRYLRLAGIV